MSKLKQIMGNVCRAASMGGLSADFGLQASGHNLSQSGAELIQTQSHEVPQSSPRHS
jgi:hypothetical protein